MSLKRRLAALDPSVYSSTKRKAELGVLQPFLGVELIAELWTEGTEYSKEGYLELLKENIRDGYLACMTFGQWKEANEKEKQRVRKTKPPKQVPGLCRLVFSGSIVATKQEDWVPEDNFGGYVSDTSGMSDEEKLNARRMYVVNRIEFKKWLQENDEWPLPDECLLARWWENKDGDEEANAKQVIARKQQKEKAIQVLIERVLEKNPNYKAVDVWNKIKKYDDDDIIQKQEPRIIREITGNEDAFIEYVDPITGTAYKPIKLKAVQERISRARKKLTDRQ